MRTRLTALAPLTVSLALFAGCMGSPQRPGSSVGAAQRASDALLNNAHASTLLTDGPSIADVAERTVASVVHIASKRTVQTEVPPELRRFMQNAPPQQTQRGAGSGVIVGDGLILTNNHVIEGAQELVVTLNDGRTFNAHVRGADPATDVALVQLDGDVPKDLPVMTFGNSDNLRLGEVVLAIGSPFELQGTVTMGIISARGRHMGLARYEDFIQTDAAINPGNSGGALVSLSGELIGINTAIGSRSGGYDGIGFAIPSGLAQDIMTRLLRDGHVVRGYLGVMPTDVVPEAARSLGLATPRGALLAEVTPGSAAAQGGLQIYDVITAVDEDEIRNAADLRNAIAMKGANSKVSLNIVRDGKPKVVRVVLGTLDEGAKGSPAEEEAPVQSGLAGVRLIALDDLVRQQLNVRDPSVRGAVVASVDPGSDAAEAGLQPGDIIVEMNRKPVRTPADVSALTKPGQAAMLRIQRGGMHTVVFVGN